MNRYKNLLSPILVGNNVIKNRTIYPNASPHVLQGPETFPAEGFRAFYANLAKNGAAIITIAEWNDPNQHIGPASMDMTHMQSFDLKDPSTHNYFSQMAEEIHFYGSKLLIEASIEMPEGYSLSGGGGGNFGPCPPIDYSQEDPLVDGSMPGTGGFGVLPEDMDPEELMNMGPGPGGPGGHTLKPLPVEMMPQVIKKFVKKIRMYRNLGYDGLAMRMDGCMTPDENSQRKDEYDPGGSVADRTRFYRQCFQAVKETLGQDFIIENIIAGEMPRGYSGNSRIGYSIEETIEYARMVQDAGIVDILQIRENDACKSHASGFTFTKGNHENIAYCVALKKAGIRLPLAPVGGYQDPEELEQYLAEGKCDMFGMARAFMADYEYGKKVREGRGEDVRPCLWCNKCHGVQLRETAPWVNVCSVNPEHGLIAKMHRLVDEPGTAKRVAVIGGGAAGMQAAISAAERGHQVTLFEKTDRLGGQMLHAEKYSFKWPLRDFKDWQIRSLDRLGVEVKLETAPTPEEIREAGFDVVFAATGAEAVRPGIPGAENCPTCADVYMGRASLGKKVVIVGGSETGMETAMHLCEEGHDVVVLTRQNRLAHDASGLHYITMAWLKPLKNGYGLETNAWEKYDNLKGILNVSTKSIENGVVTYVDKDGVEHTLEADSVVICGGAKPRLMEAMAYADAADSFFAVGDCNKGGNIQRCTRDAYAAACRI